jgi:hypothetical protein
LRFCPVLLPLGCRRWGLLGCLVVGGCGGDVGGGYGGVVLEVMLSCGDGTVGVLFGGAEALW